MIYISIYYNKTTSITLYDIKKTIITIYNDITFHTIDSSN